MQGILREGLNNGTIGCFVFQTQTFLYNVQYPSLKKEKTL